MPNEKEYLPTGNSLVFPLEVVILYSCAAILPVPFVLLIIRQLLHLPLDATELQVHFVGDVSAT